MKEKEIKTTTVFQKTLKAINDGYRYIIHEGSSRSSKSQSILQILFFKALSESNHNIIIGMKTLQDIKKTIIDRNLPLVLQDFSDVQITFNKSESKIYFPNNSTIRFIGADDETTALGIASTILWLDETNKMNPSTCRQLFMRNEQTIILSYNPAGDIKFIDQLKTTFPEKTKVIHSTYKDNPFLSQNQIDELEGLIHTDYNQYLIYCLGQRAIPKEAVYSHFKPLDIEAYKKENNMYRSVYGLDFGYHTNALVRVWYTNDLIAIQEIIYTHTQSITELLEDLSKKVDPTIPIIADSAAPAIIKDIKKAGFTIIPANKKQGSVLDGINLLKSLPVVYDEASKNIETELILYQWQKRNGEITDIPEKKNDHCMDSIRYAVSYLKEKKYIQHKEQDLSKNYF